MAASRTLAPGTANAVDAPCAVRAVRGVQATQLAIGEHGLRLLRAGSIASARRVLIVHLHAVDGRGSHLQKASGCRRAGIKRDRTAGSERRRGSAGACVARPGAAALGRRVVVRIRSQTPASRWRGLRGTAGRFGAGRHVRRGRGTVVSGQMPLHEQVARLNQLRDVRLRRLDVVHGG